MNNLPEKFNIRVYGIFINKKNEILITDEYRFQTKMTKFPGGGLHFGEGTIDCLRREILEECGQKIKNINHFYTTDFYQKALYFENHQLISIYYTGELEEPLKFKVSKKPFDFDDFEDGNQSFRWVPLAEIKPELFTFPIDMHVATLIQKSFRHL